MAKRYRRFVSLEQALFEHQFRTAFFPGRCSLFRGLKDEEDVAVEFIAHSRENLGRSHQHGDMGVVAAGVHDANVLPVVGRGYFGSEG